MRYSSRCLSEKCAAISAKAFADTFVVNAGKPFGADRHDHRIDPSQRVSAACGRVGVSRLEQRLADEGDCVVLAEVTPIPDLDDRFGMK